MDYAKILIVDDEPANVRLLEQILKKANYCRIVTMTDVIDELLSKPVSRIELRHAIVRAVEKMG